MRELVQVAVFQYLKRNPEKLFTIDNVVPWVARIVGHGCREFARADVKWYIANGWIQAVGVKRMAGKGKNPTLYQLKRDISKVKYRNQCAKKWLTR